MRVPRWSIVAASAIALGGCYSYRVVPVEQAPVGVTVRARVSPVEADRLRSVLGSDDRVLVGELLAPPDSNLLVAVRTAGVNASIQTHQRITLPRQGLVELEVRRLNRWKTLGVAAIAAGVLTAVAVSQFNAEKPSETDGKGGTNASRLLPAGVTIRFGP